MAHATYNSPTYIQIINIAYCVIKFLVLKMYIKNYNDHNSWRLNDLKLKLFIVQNILSDDLFIVYKLLYSPYNAQNIQSIFMHGISKHKRLNLFGDISASPLRCIYTFVYIIRRIFFSHLSNEDAYVVHCSLSMKATTTTSSWHSGDLIGRMFQFSIFPMKHHHHHHMQPHIKML